MERVKIFTILTALTLLASPSIAARQALNENASPSAKGGLNSNFQKANANFVETYATLDLKETKAVVQASAPADTTVDWYDTDQESGVLILKRHNGTTWLRASSHGVQYASSCASITAGMCVDTDDGKLYYHNGTAVVEVGSGSYTPPTASADTLGVIKVGSRLTINAEGVLSADVQSGTGAVDSVNGATGTVVLDADDISDTSTTKKFTTAAEKATWNAKQDAVETSPLTVSMVTGLFTGTENCLGANGETVACGGGGASAISDLTDWPSGLTATELGYVNGATSNIQGQINALSASSFAPTIAVGTPSASAATGPYINSTNSHFIYNVNATGYYDLTAATYTAHAITPTLSSMVIGTNGTSLTLTGSASLSIGAGGNGGFDVDCSTAGNGITATYTSGAPGTNLVYTLGTTVNSSDTCDLDYTQPGNGIEATTGGADLASITSGAITNNSTQSASTEYTVYITDNTTDFNGITSTVTKYTGTEDTIISQGPSAVYNFGGQTASEVHHYAAGDQKNLLLRFTGLSNIPSGATITLVEIGLYKSGGTASTDTFTAYRSLRAWVEGTLTGGGWASDDNPDSACWDYYGGSVAWSTAGGMGSGADIASSSSGSMAVSATLGAWNTITGAPLVTDVQNIVSGSATNNGWEFIAAGMDKYHVIQTSEGVNGQRPYLKVVYTY